MDTSLGVFFHVVSPSGFAFFRPPLCKVHLCSPDREQWGLSWTSSYFCSPVALLEFVPSFLSSFRFGSSSHSHRQTHHFPWESFSFCFRPFHTPLGVPVVLLLLLSHRLSKLVTLLVDLSPLLWGETLGFSSQSPQCLSMCGVLMLHVEQGTPTGARSIMFHLLHFPETDSKIT